MLRNGIDTGSRVRKNPGNPRLQRAYDSIAAVEAGGAPLAKYKKPTETAAERLARIRAERAARLAQ